MPNAEFHEWIIRNFAAQSYMQTMFKTVLLVALSFILTTSYSQVNETTYAPKNYLGELNGQHIYCTGLSHVRTNKITLYQIEDGEVVQKEVIQLPYDRFEQVFLFENTLYGIVSDIDETNYSLIRFDKGFSEKQRTEIMPYKDKPQSLGEKASLSKPVNQRTKFIYHSGKLLFCVSFYSIRAAIIDFQSMKAKAYDFDVPIATSFEPADALFFNETDAHVAFEYWGPSLQTMRYYATFVQGKTNAFKLNDYTQKDLISMEATSFKFIHANGRDLLVSLLYKDRLKKKHIGFTITEIERIDITELKMNPLINDKLKDPLLWSKKNYNKWKRNAFGNLYCNSKLDEVYEIDGQLIFCTRHDPVENSMNNLMVSSVNIEKLKTPIVNWNVVTHHALFNGSNYLYNQYSNAYVSARYSDHLRLFYNCKSDAIAADGSVKKTKKESNPTIVLKEIKTDIAILDINLLDGTSQYISNPYRNDTTYPKLIRSPFYYISDNTIYLILESITPATMKERILYTPKAVAFPIN